MHGLGNDFVLIDALQSKVELSSEQLRFLADRRFGVGCDQILLIEPSQLPDVDIRYRIFNADGGEVEQCGNGVRCVGDYLRRRSLIDSDSVKVETSAGLVTIYFEEEELIRVDMGVPVFEPKSIPFDIGTRQTVYSLSLDDSEIELMAVSMFNPHAVIAVEDVKLAEVSKIGPQIQAHACFPESVNVGFMEIVDREHIRLRVYERGVGETLACGTGACAAVVVGINAGKLDSKVDVELTGGHLKINWAGAGEAVWMLGPAITVFEGQIEL